MDDQAVIRTYDNANLAEGTEDRPLVTFALFAYNQEKYIREAVEGAFSQTYSPLEIILSDDCSSDRTFEIMEEMAREYKGPHLVKVRRNDFNIGTALHVQTVFNSSRGQLFIVAAGDDISMPDRTEALASMWVKERRPDCLIHSGRVTFTDRDPGKSNYIPADAKGEGDHVLRHFADAYWLPAAAPTCAYSRSVFECFPPLFGGSIIEDAPLFLRAALIGKYLKCDRPLVRQRLSDDQSGSGYRISRPEKWNRFIQSKQVAFRNMQRDLSALSHRRDDPLLDKIESQILKVLTGSSELFISERCHPSHIQKVDLASRFIRSKALSSTISGRIKIILIFFQLNGLYALIEKVRIKRRGKQ
jgi:glycosyltransferase involved in cell wall biosynthesis